MVYIITFAFLCVLWFISRKNNYISQCAAVRTNYCANKEDIFKTNNKIAYIKNNLFEIVALFLLFVLLSFRSGQVGVDLKNYNYFFDNIENLHTQWNYEIFFELLIFILKFLHLNFRCLLIIEAVMICTSMYFFITKFSKDKLLTILIIFSVGYFSYFCCVLRQVFALSFILFSIIKLFDKKYIESIIFIIIAALFHKSAIVLIIYPLIKKFKINFISISVIATISILICFFAKEIFSGISYFFNIDYFKDYSVGVGNVPISSWVSLVAQFIGLLGLYFMAKFYKVEKDEVINFAIWNMFLFVLIRLFSNVLSQLFINRLNVYTLIFIAILVPNLLDKVKFKPKIKLFIYSAIFLVLFVYMYEQYIIDDLYLINPFRWGWNT